MDIDKALVHLSEINKSNINTTKHFNTRFAQRKQQIPLNLNDIHTKIINEKPVAITKQNSTKFKLCYELSSDYDLTIIISVNTKKSLIINLVTCYIEKANKRWRKDGK